MSTMWIVVRCQSQRTLDQARDLISLGVRAWTPVWLRRKRLPRTRKTQVVETACLPSYVFAGEEALGLLIRMRTGGKLKGRVMTYDDGSFIRIQDHELTGLREVSDTIEDTAPKAPRPGIGNFQRVLGGPFAGRNCRVVGLGHSRALVSFGREFSIPAQIPYSLLTPINVDALVTSRY